MSTLDPWFVFLISYNYSYGASSIFCLNGPVGVSGKPKRCFWPLLLMPASPIEEKNR